MSESAHNEETSQNLHDIFLAAGQMANDQERNVTLTKLLFPSTEGQTTEVLSLVRRIVSSGWDKEWASDEEGKQVEEWQDEAVNFSLLAAVLKAGYILEDVVDVVVHSKAADLVFAEVREQAKLTELNIYDWQPVPERTKEDVLNVIEKALEKMKAGSNGQLP